MTEIEIEFRILGCVGSEHYVNVSHVPRVGEMVTFDSPGDEQWAGRFEVRSVSWDLGYDDGSCGVSVVVSPR